MVWKQHNAGALWHAFLYEINKATASLMYLLQGMESVRQGELAPYNKLTPVHQQYAACFPKLSYVDVSLTMSGIGFNLNSVLRREGTAEQLAYKGWVEQVYFLWDSRFRNDLKESLEGSDIIRPETDPLGDFRRIRNDLIHNKGLASEGNSGKCIVLKWFKPGERIVLGMRHVFDFLNQIGLLTKTPGFLDDGSVAAWTIFPGMEDTLANRTIPKLISLRTSMEDVLDDGSSRHAISVVFENGVFCDVPVLYGNDGSSTKQRMEFFSKTSIDRNGNLRLANGEVKDRVTLYREASIALLGKGPKTEGPGVSGPWFRIKR